MPTLNWIGKEAVARHHKEVPLRLLEPVRELSCGAADSGTNPNSGEETWPERTRGWAYSQEEHQRHMAESLIYRGKDGNGKVPAHKRDKHALRNDGVVLQTLCSHEFAGHTDGSRKELREVLHDLPSVSDFATPKPSLLVQRIFAGSGTTGHAVLKQNAEDGGSRRFILVEMDDTIARTVTAERVRRVATGYSKGALTPDPSPASGPGEKVVEGLGSGLQFCRLSAEPLFDADGRIRHDVRFAQLAEFVWFAETGTGYTSSFRGEAVEPGIQRAGLDSRLRGNDVFAASPLLEVHEGRAIYLLYNGILKDKSAAGGNVPTGPVFDLLPRFAGPKVIYAAANRMGGRAAREGITFKQTPYALVV